MCMLRGLQAVIPMLHWRMGSLWRLLWGRLVALLRQLRHLLIVVCSGWLMRLLLWLWRLLIAMLGVWLVALLRDRLIALNTLRAGLLCQRQPVVLSWLVIGHLLLRGCGVLLSMLGCNG